MQKEHHDYSWQNRRELNDVTRLRNLFLSIDVFKDFRNNYFYLSEAIEEIVCVDSICTRERHKLFHFLFKSAQRDTVLCANKVINDIKIV